MKTIVGVLRGGPSREHKVSLATGHAILSHLSPEHYTLRDIYIDKNGVWYVAGRPVSHEQALGTIDAAFPGLHGEYGEDGTVQRILERYGVPFVGANSTASAFTAHKVFAKDRAKEYGLKTPRYELIDMRDGEDSKITEIIRTFLQPVVVKPIGWGSSIGVSIVSGYAPLYRAIVDLLVSGAPSVLVEEYISGREATVGVVDGMRGEEFYTLPPVEIIPPASEHFFSQNAKYSGETREICPAQFPRNISEELMYAARTIHEALGIRHYSRSDFIVSPRGVYYLETNTLPGLTSQSLFPKSLAAVGISMQDFLEHLVANASHG